MADRSAEREPPGASKESRALRDSLGWDGKLRLNRDMDSQGSEVPTPPDSEEEEEAAESQVVLIPGVEINADEGTYLRRLRSLPAVQLTATL